MTAIRTDQHENVIAGLIGQGMPVVVLASHLGDAALSCGALLTYAVSRTPITVVTFFTEAGGHRTRGRRGGTCGGWGHGMPGWSISGAETRTAPRWNPSASRACTPG